MQAAVGVSIVGRLVLVSAILFAIASSCELYVSLISVLHGDVWGSILSGFAGGVFGALAVLKATDLYYMTRKK